MHRKDAYFLNNQQKLDKFNIYNLIHIFTPKIMTFEFPKIKMALLLRLKNF